MRLNTVHFFLFSKYFSLCYTVILRTLSLYLSILIQSCPRSSKKAPISNVADCNQSILPISIIVIHFINDFDVLFCFIYLFSSSSLFSFFPFFFTQTFFFFLFKPTCCTKQSSMYNSFLQYFGLFVFSMHLFGYNYAIYTFILFVYLFIDVS